MQSHHQR